jgi:hypothetical protein
MSSTENPLDALTALMQERFRYEGWLSQLEARRGSTPAHVFARVHGDYSERLHRVMEELAGRASELEGTAKSLADQVAALYSDETSHRDERAEAELRAAVGEFEEDRANEVISRCDAALASLGAERDKVGAELARVQEILALARPAQPGTAQTHVNAPPPVAASPRAAQPEIVPIESLAPAPQAAASKPAPSPAPAPAFDELAFLQSIVSRKSDAPSGNSRTQTQPRHETAAPIPRGDEPQPLAQSNDRRRPSEALEAIGSEMRSGQEAASNRTATPILTTPPLVTKEGAPQPSNLTPGSIPAFLKDMPTEQIKTLKCQECGTMNYPTEWYCERCGGELAAM